MLARVGGIGLQSGAFLRELLGFANTFYEVHKVSRLSVRSLLSFHTLSAVSGDDKCFVYGNVEYRVHIEALKMSSLSRVNENDFLERSLALLRLLVSCR